MEKKDAPFQPPEAAYALRQDFDRQLNRLILETIPLLKATGLDTTQALTVCVHGLLDKAAGTACRIRREFLTGEPNADLWRDVSDEAFRRAKERTAGEFEESIAVQTITD